MDCGWHLASLKINTYPWVSRENVVLSQADCDNWQSSRKLREGRQHNSNQCVHENALLLFSHRRKNGHYWHVLYSSCMHNIMRKDDVCHLMMQAPRFVRIRIEYSETGYRVTDLQMKGRTCIFIRKWLTNANDLTILLNTQATSLCS